VVETIKLMPIAIFVMFAAVLLNSARRSRGPELQRLLVADDREQRLLALTRRLAQSPVGVRCVRRRGINERFLIDIGDEEVDVRWILDVDGPAGRGRLYAWLLEVRAKGISSN
jgi:hypothetical protein